MNDYDHRQEAKKEKEWEGPAEGCELDAIEEIGREIKDLATDYITFNNKLY